uniref:Uncharacterized protein n=1 Tax=Octopus bimaculoides TaxID=37653 RepID=A0A0L8HNM1_OCTBM
MHSVDGFSLTFTYSAVQVHCHVLSRSLLLCVEGRLQFSSQQLRFSVLSVSNKDVYYFSCIQKVVYYDVYVQQEMSVVLYICSPYHFQGKACPHLKLIDSVSVFLKSGHDYLYTHLEFCGTCILVPVQRRNYCLHVQYAIVTALYSLTIGYWCPVFSVLCLFSCYFVKRRKLLLSCDHLEDMTFFLSTQSLVIFM